MNNTFLMEIKGLIREKCANYIQIKKSQIKLII